MDLIRQNKFIGWVVALLVGLNLLTLTMIWIQSERRNPPPLRDSGNSPASPVPMLQRELELTADQTDKFQGVWRNHQEKTKEISEARDNLKRLMTDEIFSSTPDKQRVDSLASGIGSLEARMEILRYEHFRLLAQICTSEQKTQLGAILREIIRRKGPTGTPDLKPQQQRSKAPATLKNNRDIEERQRPPRPDDRQGPPTALQKLDRYAERLSLSPDQIKKVKDILALSRTKEEKFKSQSRPSPADFEIEKQKVRNEEDESIVSILNPRQKVEFEEMVRNRGKK
ncbi:MAG: periplasmic heavy metal sensor [Ignavibacteriales bacterium]|nr:periplasmic heavy metal sensor [Ignavibacteriales bacterium]